MIAAVIAKKKRYIRIFKQAKALSAQQALSLEELGIRKGPIFNKLMREGIIREKGKEQYYLDESREADVTVKRRRVILIVLIAIMICLAVVFGVFK